MFKYFTEFGGWYTEMMRGVSDVYKLPFAYAFAGEELAGIEMTKIESGPGGKRGMLFTLKRRGGSNRIDHDLEKWKVMDGTDSDPNQPRCWFGRRIGETITPKSLLRADVPFVDGKNMHTLFGRTIRMGDGQLWDIPAARVFNEPLAEIAFQDKGGVEAILKNTTDDDADFFQKTMEPLVEFPIIRKSGGWVRSDSAVLHQKAIWKMTLEVDKKLEDPKWDESGEAADCALQAVRAFYRIGPDEASELSIFTVGVVHVILQTLTGNLDYVHWVKKKQASILETAANLIMSNTGSGQSG